ncbi:MAG: hypothetical protein F4X44_05495 [Gammaproteobacteria bacterium]|nr:hypothetical protein [Gammaproteobacteria bacterium]MYD80045.1 hypothetical protein [Gammaproteobacteria bacterium]
MLMLTVLVSYQALLIGIGLWARRRSETHDDFLIGGRKMGGIIASLSYAAGASSAWSILGLSGIAFSIGVSAIWLLPGTIIGHIVAWFFIAPRIQRAAEKGKHVTLTDFLVDGVSGWQRKAAILVSGIAIVFCFSFYIAAQFDGAGTALASEFNIPTEVAIVVGAAVVLTYRCLDGFWAESITDSLQAIVMFVAALILPVTAIVALGVIGPIFSSLFEQHLALTVGNMGWMAAGFLLTVLLYSLHNTVGAIAERVIPFVVGWLLLWLDPSFLKRTPENKLHRPIQANGVELPLGSIPRT